MAIINRGSRTNNKQTMLTNYITFLSLFHSSSSDVKKGLKTTFDMKPKRAKIGLMIWMYEYVLPNK